MSNPTPPPIDDAVTLSGATNDKAVVKPAIVPPDTPDPSVLMPREVLVDLVGDDAQKAELLAAWDRENELRHVAEDRLAAVEAQHAREMEGLRTYLTGDCYICHHAADFQKACSRCHNCPQCKISRLEAQHQQEIAARDAEIERLRYQWSVMAMACGNWRDFGVALTPEVVERRRLIGEAEYRVAARAILEREEALTDRLALRQRVQKLEAQLAARTTA